MYLFGEPVLATSPYYAFQQSDSVGKGVVILLFFGSIFVWTIMLEKGLALSKAKKGAEAFIRLFRDKRYPLNALREANADKNPVSTVFLTGAEKLMMFYGIAADEAIGYGSSRTPSKKLTTAEIETLRAAMEREVADQILALEDKIGLLATAVSASPFFGLFGTVWGVMMAFCSIASLGRADISALAPGVSGALLTTVVGLLVAIPSLIGYNLLTNMIRKITVYMDNFVEEVVARVRLEQHED